MKKIVVIGTGRMGGAFATAFAKRMSHTVSIRGSHAGSSSAAALSRQLGVRVADDKELLAADVVFVATPPGALDDVAAALKGYAGIIVSANIFRMIISLGGNMTNSYPFTVFGDEFKGKRVLGVCPSIHNLRQ